MAGCAPVCEFEIFSVKKVIVHLVLVLFRVRAAVGLVDLVEMVSDLLQQASYTCVLIQPRLRLVWWRWRWLGRRRRWWW